MMTRYLIKVYSMNPDIEKQLLKYGELEIASNIFKIYMLNTSESNLDEITKIKGVITITKEGKAKLMPLSV